MSLTFETIKNFSSKEKEFIKIYFELKYLYKDKSFEDFVSENNKQNYLIFINKIQTYSKDDLRILKWIFVNSEQYPECYHCNEFSIELISKLAVDENNYEILQWIISQGETLSANCLFLALDNKNFNMVNWLKDKNSSFVNKIKEWVPRRGIY
jgi:hypothetical protein